MGVIHKNKDTGERKIRYEGPNEAHAVKELYDRLVAEIKNQKAHNVQNSKNKNSKTFNSKNDNLQKEKWYSGKASKPSSDGVSLLLVILAFICFFFYYYADWQREISYFFQYARHRILLL